MIEGKSTESAPATPLRAPLVHLLSRNALFATLPEKVRAQLAGRLVPHLLTPGVDVLRGAEEAAGLFVIESGCLATVIRGANGAAQQVVSTHGPPDALGASALIGGGGSLEYIALAPSVVYLLPKDVCSAVIRQVPEFALAVSQSVAQEAARFMRDGAIPWVDLNAHTFDKQLWACLPASLSSRADICPLELSNDTMTVAVADPRDVAMLDALTSAIPGVKLRVVACSAEDLARFIGSRNASRRSALSSARPPATGREAQASFRFLSEESTPPRDAASKTPSTPPPAVSVIDEVVGVGLSLGASDIHVEPQRDGVLVRYRVDGALHRARN